MEGKKYVDDGRYLMSLVGFYKKIIYKKFPGHCITIISNI